MIAKYYSCFFSLESLRKNSFNNFIGQTKRQTLLHLVFLIQLLISFASFSQINGTIIDSKTNKPLPGVEAFIDHTTINALSDEAGQFSLESLDAGYHELVLYKNGYILYKSNLKIATGRVYNIKFTLTQSKKTKASPLTSEEKSFLRKTLIGADSTNSLQLLNVDDIDATIVDGKKKISSKMPLTVVNNTTGYRMSFYVADLAFEEFSAAPVKLESLPVVVVKQSIYQEKNRKKYFQGSQRHWLLALTANLLKEEGFSQRDENGAQVLAQSLVSPSSLQGYVKVNIEKPIGVSFTREDGIVETSRVWTNAAVNINSMGVPLNPKGLFVEGSMTEQGLAWQLPLDYLPIEEDVEATYEKKLERFYEKVYIHTDKPYYYPGESIWFKGYINYKEPAWRDSLSRIVYVEFISPNKEIMQSKTLAIDSGFFSNDFILPDSIKTGNYYLRAYTNLNRNFGDSTIYVKTIPVIGITDKVDYTLGNSMAVMNPMLTVAFDKPVYKTREKITLTLNMKDKEGSPLASNLSITVTDIAQVVPIPEKETILNSYTLTKPIKAEGLAFPVEYGLSFKGRFVNEKGKPEAAMLTVLQTNPRNMMVAEAAEDGLFSLTGLNFYDTTTLAFKADKAKQTMYGKVELLKHELPPLLFKLNKEPMTIQNTQTEQRKYAEYEKPGNSIMLDEVVVKASRIEEQYEKNYRINHPYGKPDYVLKENQINRNYSNLLEAIKGKFPGVMPDGVTSVRGLSSSLMNAGNIMVMVNNVAVGGDAATALSMINVQDVESVEFTTRINVLYGSQGMFGVYNIVLKQGVSDARLKSAPNFQPVKAVGVASTRKFKFPDYDDSKIPKTILDYRATVYWNPNVSTDNKTGETTVTFFSSALQGKYRVLVEGVTQTGVPVRAVYFLEISND